ncbi:MAG: hypothetical protein U5L45_09805 [Saprospiraceae bacterium]|nr:hypothetical protein [Saprospiraceae bacterium]
MVHFSGFARKMNHIPPSRERSERVTKQLLFFYIFHRTKLRFFDNFRDNSSLENFKNSANVRVKIPFK